MVISPCSRHSIHLLVTQSLLAVQHTPLMRWWLRSSIGGKWGAPMGKQPPESWKYIYQVSSFVGERNYQESAWEAATNTIRRLEVVAKALCVTADRLLVPEDLCLLVRNALCCEGGKKLGRSSIWRCKHPTLLFLPYCCKYTLVLGFPFCFQKLTASNDPTGCRGDSLRAWDSEAQAHYLNCCTTLCISLHFPCFSCCL